MDGNRVEIGRRTLLKLAAGAGIGGGAVAAGVYVTSEPAVAASGLSAEDVAVDSADGRLQELTIAPTVTAAWKNYPRVSRVAVRFRANGPQSNGTVIDWTSKAVGGSQGQSSGELSFDLEETNMLGKNDGPLDASSFRASDGETTTNDVAVAMDLRLVDSEGNAVETRTPIQEVTYTVRVTGLESAVSVSGQLNTGAECLSVDESLLHDLKCSLP